ncbi:MAG: S1-C subfamily serine protease, partial [Pseudohongiellaceae bacterium]
QARIGGSSGQAIAANSAADIRNEFRGARLEGVKEDNKYANQGVEVVSLSQFEDAWAAGLREGDVIVEVNRRSIADLEAFNRVTSASAANSKNSISALTVIREGRRILMFL